MKSPVLQTDGTLPDCPATELAAGDCAVWRLHSNAECEAVLDAVLGIVRPPAGAVRWFGRDLAVLSPGDVMHTLCRIAPLTPSGGLIGNISLEENILLTAEVRGREQAAVRDLHGILQQAPWNDRMACRDLALLPYQAGNLRRALAGVLRACLVQPEAVVAGNVFHLLEHEERASLASALSWWRARQPACAWLFIQTESDLPQGFAGNTLKEKP